MDHNWLTPKARVHQAEGKGWGAFAIEPIATGETVAAFGGWVIDRASLAQLSHERQSRSIQVDDDLYLVSAEAPEPGDMINHSCAPNCGLSGAAMLVAMRDIAVDEEITFDYAMSDASDYDEFACMCGEPTCRLAVTGADWRDPGIQAAYDGWFSPYLNKRIASLLTP